MPEQGIFPRFDRDFWKDASMSVDFSHYSATTAAMVDMYVARGGQPTDEMLLEAFERLDCDDLPTKDGAAIVRWLSRKRGRPTKVGQERHALARRIMQVDRGAMPANFQRALAERIAKGQGVTDRQRAISHHRSMQSLQRNNMIRYLYHLIKKQIDDGTGIRVPHVGSFNDPRGGRSPSERALDLAHLVLSERLAMHPPAARRMMNIIAYN